MSRAKSLWMRSRSWRSRVTASAWLARLAVKVAILSASFGSISSAAGFVAAGAAGAAVAARWRSSFRVALASASDFSAMRRRASMAAMRSSRARPISSTLW